MWGIFANAGITKKRHYAWIEPCPAHQSNNDSVYYSEIFGIYVIIEQGVICVLWLQFKE